MFRVFATIAVAMLSGNLAIAEEKQVPIAKCGIEDLDCEKDFNVNLVQLKEYGFPAALALSIMTVIDPTVLEGFQTGSAISLNPRRQNTDFDVVWKKLTAQAAGEPVLTNYHVAVYNKEFGYLQAPVYCNLTECSAENVGEFVSLNGLPDDSVLISKDRKEFRDNGGKAVSINFNPSADIKEPIFSK